MAKRLLKYDREAGKEVWMHDNPEGGWTIEQKQHFKHVLESNKQQQNAYQKGSLQGNTQAHWQKVADIPNIIYLQLRQKFGEPRDNPKAWRKWLNDYDNRYFRSGGGNI